MKTNAIGDLRYGLVGFGGAPSDLPPAIEPGHSYTIAEEGLPANERLFTSVGDTTTPERIKDAFAALQVARDPSLEDGWDAIEHTLAEYEFREGAVPILVLVQSDEGRVELNTSLTETGVLASLEAHNAILNVIVPGEVTNTNAFDRDRTYEDLFSIASLSGNQRVIGVEADTDADSSHDAYAYTESVSTIGSAVFDDGMSSLDTINGQTDNPSIAVYGETENAYVRMAWATGGAAWDAGIIDAPSQNNGGPLADQDMRENALSEAFATSLVGQIKNAFRRGAAYTTQEMIAAMNFGGAAVGDFAADPNGIGVIQPSGTPLSRNPLSNSVPADIPDEVFRSVRVSPLNQPLNLTIDQTLQGGAVADGTYTLELLFNNPGNAGPIASSPFSVVVEGATADPLLSDYSYGNDMMFVEQGSGSVLTVDSPSDQNIIDQVAVVKRFEIDVTGGDGLQIELIPLPKIDPNGQFDYTAFIAGARLLQRTAPPVLIGDYNLDFQVSAADYTLWRETWGQQVAPFTGADGNGDGRITDADYCVWAIQYGDNDPIPLADYNDDGVVDAIDYTVWKTAYADYVNNGVYTPAADGNDDGVINPVDWFLWKETYGSTLGLPAFSFFATPTAHLYEVSTLVDEFDGDYSDGDLSLREAVSLANAAGGPATLLLPAGLYSLSRTGSEAGDASYNDLDISGNVQILGDGPGQAIIDNGSLLGTDGRAFDVGAVGSSLELIGLTIANGSGTTGQAARVKAGAKLTVLESSIVNHSTYIGGVAIEATNAEVVIRRSVFTNNDNTGTYGGAAIRVQQTGAGAASITVGESLFAYNIQPGYYAGYDTQKAVAIVGGVAKTNDGKNLYDEAAGGFFDTTPGIGDHLGSPDYVVSTVADTFDHTNDAYSLSLREAIDLANQNPGQEEVWLPAWDFVLTRSRGNYGGGSATDTDVGFGDLDIKDQLTIRGVEGKTTVQWKPGVVDSVFDLLGDADQDGQADQDTNAIDYTIWSAQDGSGSGTSTDWEVYSADFDDDGDVDAADHAIWSAYFGNSLDLFDVAT